MLTSDNQISKTQLNDTSSIDLLIVALAGEDIVERQNALKALIRSGTVAVTALVELLKSPHERSRWEAAKALGKIGGPEAAEALTAALDDESRDVRWLAADGLIAMGMDALMPLLRGLIVRSRSALAREASSHVLHAFLDVEYADIVSPVIAALAIGSPVEEVPVAAHEALNNLRALRRKQPQ